MDPEQKLSDLILFQNDPFAPMYEAEAEFLKRLGREKSSTIKLRTCLVELQAASTRRVHQIEIGHRGSITRNGVSYPVVMVKVGPNGRYDVKEAWPEAHLNDGMEGVYTHPPG
jgi:hypothetical protein